MAWTATLTSFRRIDDRVEVLVLLNDDITGTARTIQYAEDASRTTRAWLRQQVLRTIASFAVAEPELTEGLVIDTAPDPPTPPAPPDPPDPVRAAREQFMADWQRYQNLRRGVAAGLLSAIDPLVTSLLATLRATWVPDYEDTLSP